MNKVTSTVDKKISLCLQHWMCTQNLQLLIEQGIHFNIKIDYPGMGFPIIKVITIMIRQHLYIEMPPKPRSALLDDLPPLSLITSLHTLGLKLCCLCIFKWDILFISQSSSAITRFTGNQLQDNYADQYSYTVLHTYFFIQGFHSAQNHECHSPICQNF